MPETQQHLFIVCICYFLVFLWILSWVFHSNYFESVTDDAFYVCIFGLSASSSRHINSEQTRKTLEKMKMKPMEWAHRNTNIFVYLFGGFLHNTFAASNSHLHLIHFFSLCFFFFWLSLPWLALNCIIHWHRFYVLLLFSYSYRKNICHLWVCLRFFSHNFYGEKMQI